MIAQIRGKLVGLNGDSAVLQLGDISYEIMLPGYVASALASGIGSQITLYTMEYYEGTPAGGNLIPRMIGFLNTAEKTFFNKYISVRGIGIRKGLKSLSLPIGTIASAIENGDEKILITLPEIGKRLAQHMIAELKGKLESFAVTETSITTGQSQFRAFQIEALEILIAWGEKRNEAMEMIEAACKKEPDLTTAEELVPLVYRMKQGIEV